MKKHLRLSAFSLSLIITLGFIALKIADEYGAVKLNFLDLVEMKALDSKFLARGKIDPGNSVVIVAADEKSMTSFGQWPWPRKVFADLVTALTEAEVKVIGFDAIFAEEDTFDATCTKIFSDIARGLGKAEDESLKHYVDPLYGCGANDRRFGDALKKAAPTILGYFFFSSEEEIQNLQRSVYLSGEKTIYPSRIPVVMVNQDLGQVVPKVVGVQTNIPQISAGSHLMGYFNQIPDMDGLYRTVPMVLQFGENYYPSLVLEMLQVILGGNISLYLGTDKLLEEEGKLAKLTVGEREIPVSDSVKFTVKYYGPGQTFKHISAADVINRKVGKKELKDKAVVFGVTTTGIFDMRPTPMESMYPGVEIHATVLENILSEDYLTRPNMLKMIEVLIMLAGGIGLGLMLSRLRLQFAVAGVFAVLIAYIFFDYEFFFLRGLHSRFMLFYGEVFILMMTISVYRYFTEEREKGKIRRIFQTYVAKNVVEEVLKDTSKLQLGGQKKFLTVFFSDIRGFTTISEKLTPEKLVHQLNEYLTPMTNIIFKYDGTLDKYMGDAIMAIFGAPLEQTDHAARCCSAALDMMDELRRMRVKWKSQGLPELNIGIGINSGDMIVGNMGSDVKFEYTVIGDNVNLASRLEGTNKEYGTNIVISEFTRKAAGKEFRTRELDLIRVKGKKEPVRIYEVRGKGEPDLEETQFLSDFSRALSLYREKKWDEAAEEFGRIYNLAHGDPPSKRYLERIEIMKQEPPPEDWDGVWVMKTK